MNIKNIMPTSPNYLIILRKKISQDPVGEVSEFKPEQTFVKLN